MKMAKGIEGERKRIEAEEAKLKERRNRLAEMERSEITKRLEKSLVTRLPLDQLDQLLARIKKLGIGEVLKRLS